jgi:putative von willebrand factor type A domain protein
MKKNSLPIRSLTAALSVKRSLPAILAAGLLMGSFAQRAQAQATTPVQSEETTHNLLDRVVLIKASAAGKVKFTLAPEDPTKVTRDHWPIVFIDYENDGKNIRQMYNLTEDREFEVNVAATEGGVIKITGEDGMWKLVSASQTLKDATFNTASALRYVDLHDNVLGTANAQGEYALQYGSSNIETLNLATNKLKNFVPAGIGSTVRELNLSENLLPDFNPKDFNKVHILDLSKNLLTSIAKRGDGSSYANDAFKEANWTVYKGGNATAFNKALGNNPADLYTSRTLADDAMINLTINKLNIATLTKMPTNLPKEHYYYTLQQRYEVPLSPQGNDVWRPLQTMDLSSQLNAIGVAGSEKTTRYEVWREIDAATDQYVRVPATDYQISGGRITFRRGYGENARLFVAMTTDAFNTDGYPLESFERGTTPITTDGFDAVLKQPEGTASGDRRTYFATVKAKGQNDVGDGETRVLAERFFRTNTFTLDASELNYWYGYINNDWANAENWTGRFVPNTLVGNYANNQKSDVVFASVNTNPAGSNIAPYGETAIRDLYADQNRVVRNYINATENGRAMVATPGNQILLKEKAYLWDLVPSPLSPQDHLRERGIAEYTVVQAEEGKPNGTFLIEKPASNPNYKANVEMFAKSFDGNRNKTYATWQYFGSPVKAANRDQLPLESTWVRKYNRTLNVPNSDEKWEDVTTGTLTQGEAYEITQPKPANYRFIGELNTGDFTFNVNGMASATNYQDMNILANPYTGAMNIEKLDFSGATAADKVVYLFNTGSRKDWIANNGANATINTGVTEGQYTKAIPANLAGYVNGMPKDIPSLSSFMVKSTGAGTLKYRYADLVNVVATENRAPERRFHSLAVDVESAKSADRLWLVQAEGTTDRYDNGWDGEKIFAPGETALYAMQDRSYQVTTTETIGETKLGFVPAEGEQNYKLTFHIDGADGAQEYTLLDKRTGLTRAIHDGDTYEFTAAQGDAAHRFTILGNGAKATADQRGFQISADLRRNFTVKNFTDEPAEALVFDAAGKIQARFKVEAGSENTGTVVMPGAYVVRVSNKVTTLTQRFVMP